MNRLMKLPPKAIFVAPAKATFPRLMREEEEVLTNIDETIWSKMADGERASHYALLQMTDTELAILADLFHIIAETNPQFFIMTDAPDCRYTAAWGMYASTIPTMSYHRLAELLEIREEEERRATSRRGRGRDHLDTPESAPEAPEDEPAPPSEEDTETDDTE